MEEAGFEPANSLRQDHPFFDLKSCISKSRFGALFGQA